MRNRCARLLAWVLLIVCGLMLQASFAWAQESRLDLIKKRGKLIAGVRFDYPPYGFVDKSGTPAGLGMEVAKYFAAKLGVGLEHVQLTSQARIPLIVNGTIDADIGVTTRSADREQVIDFSIVYVWEGMTLLVRKDSGIKTIQDASAPKVVDAVQGGNNGDLFLKANPKGKVIYFQDYPQAALAVKNKRADAASVSRAVGLAFAKEMPELEVLKDDFFHDQWAIGIRHNDSKWRNWINHTLQEMWCRGEYQKAYEKFIGAPPNFKLWSPYGLQPGITC